MSYIGNTPAENYASFLTETFSVSATTNYTLSHAVTNENDIRLVINGVVQQPGSGKAYTASGTTLTLTSATVSGDVMYAVYLGRALQTVNPPNASVGTAQISSSAKSTNLLNPAFEAYLSSTQTISNSTHTLTEFDTEVFDTDNAYNNSTNYRFTPQVAGKYFVYANVQAIGSPDTLRDGIINIQKNGANYKESRFNPQNGAAESELHLHAVAIISMNGSSDYITVNGYINVSSGTPQFSSDVKGTYFGAYRIGE